MMKMENESNLHVTFSKRRAGLFKKGSEISTLCGVEPALVVFSPAQRAYSFGQPSANTVIDRYLGCNAPATSQPVEANFEANVNQLNMQLTQVTSHLDDKKKRGDELKQMKRENQQQNQWLPSADELDRSQLLQLKSAMEGLRNDVQKEKLVILNANPHLFYMGNSSNVTFNPNMMDGGYTVPPPEYDPTDAYIVDPAQGYNNPNPAQGYNNPDPAQISNANFQGNDVPGPHGYGGGNDVLGPLNFGPQGFGGRFSG